MDLTPTEQRVVIRLARGLSVRGTADELGLAPRTVDTHKTSAMKKLGVHHRIGLARAAIKVGLLTPKQWLRSTV